MYLNIRDDLGKDAAVQVGHPFNHLLAAVMKLLNTECEQSTVRMLKYRNKDDGMRSPCSLQQARLFHVLTKADHAPAHYAH